MKIKIRILSLLLGLFFTTSAFAEDQTKGILPIPDYGGDIWNRSHLTGDWGGKRTEWTNKGVQTEMEYLGWTGSVIDGGNDSSTETGNNLSYKLKLDLMRAGFLPRALIDIRAETRYGHNTNPNANQAEPHFTASLPPVDYTDLQRDADFTITNLTYTQFLSERFGVFLGKLDLFEGGDLNEFASGRGRTQFQNYNFNFGAPTLLVPASTLGAGILYMPNKYMTFSSTLLSGTDCSYNNCFHDLDDSGRILANAATFQYRLGGLPGGMNVNGLYFFDQDFTELGTLGVIPGEDEPVALTSTKDHSWLAVLSAWQYLSAKGAGEGPLDLTNQRPDLEGWGVFGRLSFADKDTNPIQTSVSVGIGGRGVIPIRPNDVFGLGYYYNDLFSTNLDNLDTVENHTQGVEVFYNIAITPAAKFSVNLQHLGGGVKSIDNSTVASGRLQLIF
ncbi:MAG: carbohydrate porin [candidate division Zixibacteria bacterium]